MSLTKYLSKPGRPLLAGSFSTRILVILKYFKHYDIRLRLDYTYQKLITAAMKFLPYNGFYQQKDSELARMFNDYYLSDDVLSTTTFRDDSPMMIPTWKVLELRANASSYQQESHFWSGVL